MKVQRLQALRINCPEWYQRQDFMDWLNEYTGPAPGGVAPGWPVASWHTPGEPSEMSDIFMVYDGGEGSGMDVCPVWDEINEIAQEVGFRYGIIWLVNMESA